VNTLVAGPGVYICDACVALCTDIIKDKPSPSPPEDHWEQAMSLDDVLASLPKMALAGAQVEQRLTNRVRKARSLGATWARIGAALGMTRQSAWERFSGEE
jgi:ATP-dependent protease Clp ATPase subunit